MSFAVCEEIVDIAGEKREKRFTIWNGQSGYTLTGVLLNRYKEFSIENMEFDEKRNELRVKNCTLNNINKHFEMSVEHINGAIYKRYCYCVITGCNNNGIGFAAYKSNIGPFGGIVNNIGELARVLGCTLAKLRLYNAVLSDDMRFMRVYDFRDGNLGNYIEYDLKNLNRINGGKNTSNSNAYDSIGSNWVVEYKDENGKRIIYDMYNSKGESKAKIFYWGDEIRKFNGGVNHLIVGRKISKLGRGCFEHAEDLMYLEFETGNKGLRTIPKNMCYDTGIEAVKFSDNIEVIGSSAFENCDKLTYPIVSTAKRIGYRAFACSGIQSVKLVDCCDINEEAFYGCSKLRSVKIQGGNISIGKSAFERCKTLREVELPYSTERICSKAFKGCRSLKHITVPKGCVIEDGAFDKHTHVERR